MLYPGKALIMDIELSQLHLCLDALEEKEAALLGWGDCDGFFSEQEVLSILEQVLPGHDSEMVRIELLEHAMLFEVPYQPGVRVYRTRMAEGVHLYRNLRQWFRNQPIEQSRTLVSDYRFIRRPRSYPKRELDPNNLLKQWQEELNLSALELGIMQQLLHPIQNMRLSGFQVRGTARICKAWQYHNNPSFQGAKPTGTIVCAGTGSGKTLSFYLPALTMLASDICNNPGHRVRILAIYPRTELLKDQFMETWKQCRKLDTLMQQRVGRKLCIGAFYGGTPYNIATAKNDINSTEKMPFDLMSCGKPGCRWLC